METDEFGGVAVAAPKPQTDEFGGIPVEAAKPPDFSDPAQTEAVRNSQPGKIMSILRAGWSGANEGFGTQPLGMSDEDVKWMQDHGMFRKERDEGLLGVFKAFNEVVLYQGAKALDAAIRLPGAVYHGVGDAAIEAGVPRDVVAMPEAFFGSPHPTGVPKVAPREGPTIGIRPTGVGEFDTAPVQLREAHDLGVIGPEKPEPTFKDSPSELAEKAVPRSLSSDVTPEQQRTILGHEPGEYDARGKEWVSKIDEPDDVRNAIEKIAAENDFFPQARGGQVSAATRNAVAEAAGIDPADIDAEHFSTHFDNDGKVRAVIQVLRQTAKDYSEAADAAVKNPTPENLAAAAEAQMRHTHALEYTMGLRAESGRSLAAWKELLRETERTRAKVELRQKEQTGEVPKGAADIIDAATEVRENLKDPAKKPGLQRLIESAQALVDNADKTPPEKEGAPRQPSPEVNDLVNEARKVLKSFGADKDANLEAFREQLEKLTKGEGKLGDTVEAARALIEKDAKPKEAEPKVVSAKAQLKAAAKRLVAAADNETAKTKARESSVRDLMETARQAVGLLRKLNLSPEITEFREALSSKDPAAAAEAAQRLIDAEGKQKNSPAREKAPVEYDKIMSAAQRVAKAVQDKEAQEKAALMPDVQEIVDNAGKAVGELKKARESALGNLIDQAEKQAANMTKQRPSKEPAEALPPELQALVDKTKRVVDRFGGIARGERAALLLARTGRTFAEQEELARSVSGLTPNQVAKVLNKLRTSPEASKPGWFYWLWQQGLISGLITHSKYLAVNTTTIFLERVLSPLVANAIGKARGEQVSLRGPLYANVAMVKALPDAFSAAGQAFKTGVRVPLESEMRLFQRGEESPQTKGANAAYTQTTAPEWGIWNKVFNETQLDKAAKVLGIPGKSANMIHTFYKVLSERAAASSIAFDAAFKEGSTGDKFWQRYQYHLDNPTDEALRQSVTDAYTGAFMAKLGPGLTKFSHALSKNPVTKWMFPFQHIPWNIERMTVEYTPFKVLGPEMRSALLGEKGAPAQNLAIAKMAIGSSVMGYFIHKVLAGDATGDYPTDQKERQKWEMLGIQPNSIKIGGQWVSMERLGPVGNVAHMGASIGSIIQHYDGHDDDALTSAIWASAVATANQIGNEVGFQTLRNVIDALERKDRATRFVAYQAGSFMPFSSFVSQNASAIDPYQRKADTLIDGLKYRIPFLRETLLPKRDPLFGEPVENPGYHSIVRTSQINTDGIKAELDQLGYYPTAPDRTIKGVKLTPELYDEYQVQAGTLTREMLDRAVSMPHWHDMNVFARHETVKKVVSAARSAAETVMMANHPQILQQAYQDRLDLINGVKPKKNLTEGAALQ